MIFSFIELLKQLKKLKKLKRGIPEILMNLRNFGSKSTTLNLVNLMEVKMMTRICCEVEFHGVYIIGHD